MVTIPLYIGLNIFEQPVFRLVSEASWAPTWMKEFVAGATTIPFAIGLPSLLVFIAIVFSFTRKNVLRKLLQSNWWLAARSPVWAILLPLFLLYVFRTQLENLKWLTSNTMAPVLANYLSAITIALAGYFSRHHIQSLLRSLFVQTDIFIRLPMLLGTGPIFVALNNSTWSRLGYRLGYDWIYAGVSGIQDLETQKKDHPSKVNLTVVSDYTACGAIGSLPPEDQNRYFVLPFTVIKSGMGVVLKQKAAQEWVSQKPENPRVVKLSYYKGSIHEEYLNVYGKELNFEKGTPSKNILDAVIHCDDGFILWEPSYAAFGETGDLHDTFMLETIDRLNHGIDKDEFVWTLCLVGFREDLDNSKHHAQNILECMATACEKSQGDRDFVIESVVNYLPEELLGLTNDEIAKEFGGAHTHTFDIEAALAQTLENVNDRLRDNNKSLYDPRHIAGAQIIKSVYDNDQELWPGINKFKK